jgi:methylmalonyl-CoA mutase N-terminal domain/subunit
VEEEQVRRLVDVKQNRDNKNVANALETLRKAAKTDENLMDPVLTAVRLYASLGEICGVFRQVFGEFRP